MVLDFANEADEIKAALAILYLTNPDTRGRFSSCQHPARVLCQNAMDQSADICISRIA